MAASGRLRVLISGGGGMLGSALRASIGRPSAANFFRPAVGRLLRAGSTPLGEHDVFWDPYEMRVDMKRLEDFDAVVHLAGWCGVGRGGGPHAHVVRAPAATSHAPGCTLADNVQVRASAGGDGVTVKNI